MSSKLSNPLLTSADTREKEISTTFTQKDKSNFDKYTQNYKVVNVDDHQQRKRYLYLWLTLQ